MSKLLNAFYMEEAGEGGAPGEGKAPDAAVITQATEMGWVPKEQWKGDPDKWSPADAYLERAQSILPIVLAHNRKLKEQMAARDREIEQIAKDGKEFRKMITENVRKEYETRIAELEEFKANAISEGSGVDVVETDRKIRKLETERDAKIKAETDKNAAVADQVHPDWHAWIAQNKWYEQDEDLRTLAEASALKIIKKEGLVGRPLFEKVAAEVKRLRPDAFTHENPDGERGQIVESATARPALVVTGTKKRTFADLPPEAKEACARYVKLGWAKNQEEYVTEYFKQEGV